MNDESHVISLKPKPRAEVPPPPPSLPPRVQKRPRKGSNGWFLTLIGLAAVAGASWYVYASTPLLGMLMGADAHTAQAEQAAAEAQKEIDDIVARVGRHIALPEGEVPTVATVSDPSKLADQPFFAKAKVGDKVLLYTQARKAYLYDPEADKLIEVAPITAELTP